ncbi:MAG: hypothetical protein RXR43_14080, partial [Sulfolobus sp.]
GASLYALYKGKKGFNPPSQLNASDYEKYYATLSASDNFENALWISSVYFISMIWYTENFSVINIYFNVIRKLTP